MKGRIRPQAKCHPDRPHRAFGLCNACYRALYHVKVELNGRTPHLYRQRAECHPERKHAARGLCRTCYAREAAALARARLSDLRGYQQMLQAQGGRCAICDSLDPGRGYARFAIDHDHETGQIRGLLCHRCNLALGTFASPELLARAAGYLDGVRVERDAAG